MMTGKTFLLVEDDNDDTELFNEAIEALDASVRFYSITDGREALASLSAKHIHSPDIIFLDINMPQMNGWQVLNSLKGDQSLRDIPVIMYSTSSQLKDIRMASASGALCFFTKPDSFLHLKKILEVVITYMQRDALDEVCDAVHSLDWRKS
jgi:CheY-like chemotaxis protein